MNKLYFLIIILITCRICEGQNFVPNGDFEQYIACPTDAGQLDSAMFWLTPTPGSSDYFNQCSFGFYVNVPINFGGYQNAHSGVAYSGIYLFESSSDYREYLEIQLQTALTANSCYHFRMYVSLGNVCRYATENLGIYFSNTLVTGNNYFPLPYTPQLINSSGYISDTLNWTLISGNYIATGGESYIVIGNFDYNVNTDTISLSNVGFTGAYIYVDDVCLTPCNSPCTTSIEEPSEQNEIKIYPNPFSAEINIISNYSHCEITIYDITARVIFKNEFAKSVVINTKDFINGVYFYEIRNKNEVIKKGKVVKN